MFCGSTSNCVSATELQPATCAIKLECCFQGLLRKSVVMEIRRSQSVQAAVPRRPKEAAEDLPLFESRNPEMSELLETAARAAAGDATILLTGESGTGKDVLA